MFSAELIARKIEEGGYRYLSILHSANRIADYDPEYSETKASEFFAQEAENFPPGDYTVRAWREKNGHKSAVTWKLRIPGEGAAVAGAAPEYEEEDSDLLRDTLTQNTLLMERMAKMERRFLEQEKEREIRELKKELEELKNKPSGMTEWLPVIAGLAQGMGIPFAAPGAPAVSGPSTQVEGGLEVNLTEDQADRLTHATAILTQKLGERAVKAMETLSAMDEAQLNTLLGFLKL